MACVNYSSFIWIKGIASLQNHQYTSTAYNVICTLIWALGFAWMITAYHYVSAPALNKLLSLKVFVLPSKASFIIYPTHMLVTRIYFGVVVSLLVMAYITIGNTIVAIFLASFYPLPSRRLAWRYMIRKMRSKRQLPLAELSSANKMLDGFESEMW